MKKTITTLALVACTFLSMGQVCFSPQKKFEFGGGAGVAAYSIFGADFNGDGKTDLATTLYATGGGVEIILGTGAGSFGTGTGFMVGAYDPYALTGADFNGDGKMDLATVNGSSNNLSVLLGNGTGSFGSATSFPLPTNSNPESIISADFNGDSKPDLASANYGTNTISVLLGTGTGSLTPATSFTVGAEPTCIVSSDFNGDGFADLAAANSNSNYISVLLGAGTGIFSSATSFTLAAGNNYPNAIVSADFNGDGKKDIAVTNSAGSSYNISVLLGTGTGNFASSTSFSTGTNPTGIISADFNGDGKPDLATANNAGDVAIFLGTGTGSFGVASFFQTGYCMSIISADFNGDGKPDLATANNAYPYGVSVLLDAIPATINVNTATICIGATATLTASGASTYVWNTNATTASINPSPTVTTHYTVTSTDANNCIYENTTTVTVNPLPTITLVSDSNTLCMGNSAILTASGANTYTWSTSATTATISITPSDTTTYLVMGTNSSGCMNSDSITQIVVVCNSAGIQRFASNNEVTIYPNPNNGSFVIELNNTAKQTMQMYDVNGKMVLSQTIQPSPNPSKEGTGIAIDASALNEGVYNISLQSNEGVVNKRLVIVR